MKRLVLCLALCMWSCHDGGLEGGPDASVDDSVDDSVDVALDVKEWFSAPQGVVVYQDWAFVANTAFGYEGMTPVFGKGFVTVVDMQTKEPIHRIYTSGKNPQRLLGDRGRIWVLSSGVSEYDAESGLVMPVSDGWLDEIVVDEALQSSSPRRSLQIPRSRTYPLVGLPSTMVMIGDHIWLGSSTAAALWEVDPETMTLLSDGEEPVALGDLQVQDGLVLGALPQGLLLAGSFSRDVLMVFDPQTKRVLDGGWGAVDVGRSGELMEGVCDLAISNEEVYVLLCIANTVSRVAIAQGFGEHEPVFMTTGLWPNRIIVVKDRLLVLNSGDNNVTGAPLQDGSSAETVVLLPVGSNPFDMALDSSGQVLAVTGLQSDALYLVDLQSKNVVSLGVEDE